MTIVAMPQLSHYMTEGTVTHWYKKEGDPVVEGEPLFEIETIKASIDINAPYSGTLIHIIVHEGENVPIDTPLAEIQT